MNPEDVLQVCIDEVLAGRKTPAECAASYPQFVDLEADLQTALALRAMHSLTLSTAANQRIEARLRQRAGALKAAASRAGRAQRPAWKLGWVVGPAVAAALLLAGVGTSAAASNSNPGDVLYGIKRVDESAQAFLSPPAGRALVYATLARHRLSELNVVLQRARPDANTLTQLSSDLASQTGQALAAVDAAPAAQQADLLNTLAAMTAEQQVILTAAENTAPSAAQTGLQQAAQVSADEHARALARLAQVLASPAPEGTATASPTPSTTATALPTATPTASETESAEPTASDTPTKSATHSPPGQTDVPPGQTHVPPGQTQVPPGLTHRPPSQTHSPAGQTNVPSGQTNVPPGQTKIPPGQQKTPKAIKSQGGDDD